MSDYQAGRFAHRRQERVFADVRGDRGAEPQRHRDHGYAGVDRGLEERRAEAATGTATPGRTLREARDLREHVQRTWPWDNRPILALDRKMAEESQAARARGESQDVAAILAGLRANASSRPE